MEPLSVSWVTLTFLHAILGLVLNFTASLLFLRQKHEKHLKQLRKAEKQKAREQRRKENQKRKLAKNKEIISNYFLSPGDQVGADKEVAQLGPVGSVLREIIVQNTWLEDD